MKTANFKKIIQSVTKSIDADILDENLDPDYDYSIEIATQLSNRQVTDRLVQKLEQDLPEVQINKTKNMIECTTENALTTTFIIRGRDAVFIGLK